eukprot:TRINITY_DN13313_c0_g1_i1.p1 TRINITY_DN13313_c0_g1~~TRINITY_DN13313_c0_g1_i1.p1  ORF type:complete len:126 (+),score=38.37 TRINITY_DN13313_c0_g1_i1:104-481(+)
MLLGRKVTIKTHKGTYFTAEEDGSVKAVADKPQQWEQWTMREIGGGKATFQSFHGTYLTCDDKKIMQKTKEAKAWEAFELVRSGNETALRGHNGNFVTVGHHLVGSGKVSADADKAGKDEFFLIA